MFNEKTIFTVTLLFWAFPLFAQAQKGQGRKRMIQPMEIPTYPLQKLNSPPPEIDGSLADWPKGLPAIVLDDPRQLSGTSHRSWTGKQDFSGRGALLWDSKFLYFGILVIDDWSRPFLGWKGRGVGLPPSGDSVQFRFDPLRNSRRIGPDEGRNEDVEFWFGLGKNKKTQILSSRRYLDTIILDSKAKAVMVYNKNRHFYTLEGKIPWNEILPKKHFPKDGLSFDLQIILSDFDAITDPLPQTRIGWTFGMGPIIDPMVYGTVILTEKPWDSSLPPKPPLLPKGEVEVVDEVWCEKMDKKLSRLSPTPLKKEDYFHNSVFSDLDRAIASWPRQDIVELLVLTQRRMNREVSGFLNTGVMRLFRERIRHLLKKQKKPSVDPKVHSLPGRGWWIQSPEGDLFIDPCFPLLELFHNRLQACLFTRAQSPLLRSDPLAFRMVATKKPVVCHVAFHLGGAGPLIVHPLDPGDSIKVGKGIKVSLLGKKAEDGRVTLTTGFQLTWPSGFTILIPSLSGTPQQVSRIGKPINVLILDPSNPQSMTFLKELKPRNVILEGFFDFRRFPMNSFPISHRFPEAKDLIQEIKKVGAQLWLLAPGQTWRAR